MILKYPNIRLRTVCKRINKIDKKAVRDVSKLKKAYNYLDRWYKPIFGLAANQIRIMKRIIILKRLGGRPIIMINPKIINSYLPFLSIERCFSLPKVINIKIRRFFMRVKYRDLSNKIKNVLLFGPTTFTMQQEIDHLNDRLIMD